MYILEYLKLNILKVFDNGEISLIFLGSHLLYVFRGETLITNELYFHWWIIKLYYTFLLLFLLAKLLVEVTKITHQ